MSLPARRTALALSTAVLLAGCTGSGDDAPTAAAPEVQQRYDEAVVDPAAVLEVSDQTSAGRSLLVEQVAATDGGWVVVATDDGSDVLGVGLVEPSAEPQEIRVGLAEDVEPGELPLQAQLYVDDGDREFNAADRPLAAEGGQSDELGFPGESAAFTLTLDLQG